MNEDVDKGQAPEILAKTIYRIICKRHPKVHYVKGKFLERFSIVLKKVLPSKCFEKLLKGHYKL